MTTEVSPFCQYCDWVVTVRVTLQLVMQAATIATIPANKNTFFIALFFFGAPNGRQRSASGGESVEQGGALYKGRARSRASLSLSEVRFHVLLFDGEGEEGADGVLGGVMD